MPDVVLNLVVIRSADVERAVEFYRAIGLSFTRERHGSGPEHFASQVSPTVFEVYPQGNEQVFSTAVRLGFRVPSVDAALAALTELGAEIVSAPATSPWGRRAVVRDPDGRRVELTEV